MSIYVALGGNMDANLDGDILTPAASFRKVIELLDADGVKLGSASRIWQSPAWPDPAAQPAYNNAVIEVETSLPPQDLLTLLKRLEADFGRKDDVRNAARPLDLDIIDFKGTVLRSERLTLPHPRMQDRAFVLFPLAEIAPDWRHPETGRSVMLCCARLPLSDTQDMKLLGRFT